MYFHFDTYYIFSIFVSTNREWQTANWIHGCPALFLPLIGMRQLAFAVTVEIARPEAKHSEAKSTRQKNISERHIDVRFINTDYKSIIHFIQSIP